MSGSENVNLAGTGKIDGSEIGTMRLRGEECFASDGSKVVGCSPRTSVEESLFYFYDREGAVSDFL